MKNRRKTKIEELFTTLENINWWQRLFSWSKVTYLIGQSKEEIDQYLDEISKVSDYEKDLEHSKEKHNKLEKEKIELKIKLENTERENKEINKEYNQLKKEYDLNKDNYIQEIKNYVQLQANLREEREQEIEQKYIDMENTWKDHELSVEQTITSICKRQSIDYISKEKVPFKGKPDNTIKIADQYIIFDAKSPQNKEKLNNFPTYIKTQADLLKKYTKNKDVKNTIYLVVPNNTIEILKEKLKDLTIYTGNYKVFVVSIDSLDSIILSLKEIQNYEFVDKFSPEDRDKICEVIGQLAHSTKRRIQISNYLNAKNISLLQNCRDLPESIKDKSIIYERSLTINPTIDKKNKSLKEEDLLLDVRDVKQRSNLLNSNILIEQKEKRSKKSRSGKKKKN
jgi:hypothetical protein